MMESLSTTATANPAACQSWRTRAKAVSRPEKGLDSAEWWRWAFAASGRSWAASANRLRPRIASNRLILLLVSLGVDRGDAGKFLPFEIFEQRAATGGNVTDLVGITKLVNRCDGIAAADEGEGAICSGFGDCLCDTFCAGLKFGHFEDTHRSVLKDGLGMMNDIGELFARVLPDIEAHSAIGDVVAGCARVVGIRVEFVRDDRIGGQMDAHAFGLGLGEQLLCGLEAVVLTEGVADPAAGRLEEGISHPAADDDIGRAFEEVFDD